MSEQIILSDPKPNDLNILWSIYENSFPETERRDQGSFHATINHPDYRLRAIKINGADEPVGLVADWRLGETSQPIIFLEHLAVSEAHRNLKIGERALEGWLEEVDRLHPGAIAVLEAENASDRDPMTSRRLEFYLRAGFSLNPYEYTQPNYAPDLETLSMELLSARPGAENNTPLSTVEFEAVRHHIHTEAYGLERPIIG